MAVKIVRQPKKIALIGAPSSAAAFLAGSEKAPAALRAAGLVERLQSAGFEVVDHGDCAPRLFADDDEHKRARNLKEIVAGLNDLKVRAGTCREERRTCPGARRRLRASHRTFERRTPLLQACKPIVVRPRRGLEHARLDAFRPHRWNGRSARHRPRRSRIGALFRRVRARARTRRDALRSRETRSSRTGISQQIADAPH